MDTSGVTVDLTDGITQVEHDILLGVEPARHGQTEIMGRSAADIIAEMYPVIGGPGFFSKNDDLEIGGNGHQLLTELVSDHTISDHDDDRFARCAHMRLFMKMK